MSWVRERRAGRSARDAHHASIILHRAAALCQIARCQRPPWAMAGYGAWTVEAAHHGSLADVVRVRPQQQHKGPSSASITVTHGRA